MQKSFLILVFLFSFFITQAQTSAIPKEPIKSYIEAWKEKDNIARLAIIKSFWTKESYYNDPVANVKGPEELNTMIGKFQQDFPNAILTNDIILQNDNFRSWNWEIADSEHQLFIKGRDFVTLNDKGQITILVGFFEH
jgi:hypothetical protein